MPCIPSVDLSAVSRTKLHLYKTLIKTLLIYRPLAFSQTAYTNKRIVQNKALRWIYMVGWERFIATAELHDQAYLLPQNIEWHRMVCKQTDSLRAWHTDWLDRFYRD